MKRSLERPADLAEIIQRIYQLTEQSSKRWGRMSCAQMMVHCKRILEVGTGKTVLPETPAIIRLFGICAKKEIFLFNNGIPRNMPTYGVVKLKESCNFEESRADLLIALEEFVKALKRNELIPKHALFGKMSKQHWGFLQYKHLNHHLKQFGV